MSRLSMILPLLIALLLGAVVAGYAEPIGLDTPAYFSNGQAMIPILPVLQWLEAEVEYNEETHTLTARHGEISLELQAGYRHALVNGEEKPIDERPGMEDSYVEMREDQLFVPLVFAAETLGLDLSSPERGRIPATHWNTTCGGFATLVYKKNDTDEGKKTATIPHLPLHWAAGQGRTQLVAELLDGGANVNATTPGGWTPLHWAAREGRTDAARLLLDRGAGVNAQCKAGWVPLHWAAYHNRTAVVELLLERGAEVNPAEEDGDTPLHYAARRGHKDLVALLLDKGVDVNTANKVGVTALHNAAAFNRTEVVALLIERNAEVNARTRTGITPLYWAERRYHEKTAELLREHGAEK